MVARCQDRAGARPRGPPLPSTTVPIVFDDLVAPRHTAVLTCEMRRGLVGDLATSPALRAEAEAADLVGHVLPLLRAARRAGVRIVHNTDGIRATSQTLSPIVTVTSVCELVDAWRR